MFSFLANVKFHVGVTVGVFVAYIAAEVWSVNLLAPAVNIIKELAVDSSTVREYRVSEWLLESSGPGASLRNALLILLVAKTLLSILAWAKSVTHTWLSMSMVFFMRSAVYDRLQRIGFSFYDQYSTGQLINRALSDLQHVRNFIMVGFINGIDIPFSVLGYFSVMLYRSPSLALMMLAPLPFWFFLLRRFALKSRPIYEKQMESSDEMVRILTENIAGVHVVRAFATEEQEKSRFRKACDTLLDRMMQAVGLQQRMNPLIRGVAALTNIWLFAVGAIYCQQGKLEIGDLVVFGVAMNMIMAKIQQINVITDAYQRALVSSNRFFEILDCPDTTPEQRDAEPLRPGGGAVHFSRVTFGYEPGKPVLNDVTFDVPAGSITALVGPTGSGKTTLSALMARFYDPDLGSITIDGQDIRDATLMSVRDAVGYVFQETYLFSDTVHRNIAYSDLTAPIEKVRESARIARADEFIDRLPQKYDTLIGEYGATLSGGQRQRLAIARAILHNPRILVLDDALAAVDPETEAIIRAGLERIMKGRTVFVITSRVSTARRADKIIVLESGAVTQIGTHDELIAQDGYYRQVALGQFTDEGGEQTASHMDRVKKMTARSGRAISE